MEITNFIPMSSNYDPEYDLELISELNKFLNCSLEELYVVGDDQEELETEGVAFYLSDYFNTIIAESEDHYITIYERDGVRIAMTSDHGYNNWYIAKDAIKNIPPIQNTTYKANRDAFWESWRNNK